jgi:hypothetical protein
MYNTDFIVKYRDIQDELLEKIKGGEDEYSEEEVFSICEELYRHELLSVFNIKNVNDVTLDAKINDLWITLRKNNQFMRLFLFYKDNTPISLLSENDDVLFASMFHYELFLSTHKCICEILTKNSMDEVLFTEFIKQITIMNSKNK